MNTLETILKTIIFWNICYLVAITLDYAMKKESYEGQAIFKFLVSPLLLLVNLNQFIFNHYRKNNQVESNGEEEREMAPYENTIKQD